MMETGNPHQCTYGIHQFDDQDDLVEEAAKQFARLFLEQCLYQKAHEKHNGDSSIM